MIDSVQFTLYLLDLNRLALTLITGLTPQEMTLNRTILGFVSVLPYLLQA